MGKDADIQEAAAAVFSAVGLIKRRTRDTATTELSMPERAALSRLDRNGPDTIAGLARWEQISPQAMGVTVSGLESRGLIERAPDPADRRRVILTLTRAGTKSVRGARGAVTDILADALAEHFTDDEIAQIRSTAGLIERLAQLI
jgi:DNA-binding MarR family transcriptional regulator